MKRYLILIAVLLLVAAWVAACSGQSTPVAPTVSHGGPVEDYVSLIDALRAVGAAVEPAGEVEQPFFSVKGQIITVNGADVQVFEYADEAAAEREAEKVGPDGFHIDNSIVDWVASPHFYKKARLIALYVGDDANVKSVLQNVLGAQLAGTDLETPDLPAPTPKPTP